MDLAAQVRADVGERHDLGAGELALNLMLRVFVPILAVAAGRVFVMPNVGAITTAESVALAKHAESVGADAVSAVTPYFLKPSQEAAAGP